MARTTVTVDIRPSFVKKTRGNANRIKDSAKSHGKKLAEYIRSQARNYSPRDTGLMSSLITIKSRKASNGYSWDVVPLNPVDKGGSRYRSGGKTPSTNNSYNTKGVFDLVKWAHKSSYANRHFNSGYARFMFKARGDGMKERNRLIKSSVLKKGIIK